MKKLLPLLVIVAGFAANADVLYWMVDTTSSEAYASKYTAICLKDSDGHELTKIQATQTDIVDLAQGGGYFTYTFSDPAFSSTASYYVELVNGDAFVAESARVQGSSLISSGSLIQPNSIGPAGVPASFGSYNVPEPTSGLLFVIGGMLLGLKRKRQV